VHRGDSSGICPDPGNRVFSCLDTGSDIELERDTLRSVGGKDLHWSLTALLAIDGDKLRLMIVESGLHLQRGQLLGGHRQLVGDSLPAVETIDTAGTGHYHVL